MGTFLKLASLVTLISGAQLLTPATVGAEALPSKNTELFLKEMLSGLLTAYNDYKPRDNGGPKGDGDQGSGTR